MKKRITLFLVLICTLSLVGCGNRNNGSLSGISHTDADGTVFLTDMSENAQNKIIAIIDNGTWADDVCQCASDFSFELQGDKIKYSSECGTFNNVTKRQHMVLSDDEKAKVNQLLGVATPTPTKCPDSALPSLWMNGKLYKVESMDEHDADFTEEDLVGTVESEVGYNYTPTKEMESNILPVGASIYKCRDMEDTYVGIRRKNGLVYYYKIFDNTGANVTKTEESVTSSVVTRIEVNSLLFKEYNDLRDTYHYEPKYSAAQWMNEAGELLFPYEKDLNNDTKMADDLAILYMPEEVLLKASTEDLLQVVIDGFLETNITSISVYSTPSHYIRSCTIKNQAANELMRRSDMVTVLYEDYCSRNYRKGEESREGRWAADKLQFDEIILASNHAFALMDDTMKKDVLQEALEKHEQERSGEYYTVGHTSGFFAFIAEEQLNGGSDWYQYIHDNNIESAKNAICFDETCWLEQFYTPSETAYDLVPPGTLTEVSAIPQPDQSEVTSVGTYSFDLFDVTSFAYFYNQKSKEECLVLVNSGTSEFAQLLVLETDFGGAAGLKNAIDETFQAKLLACKNISFEEGQYAYNASLAVDCASEERIDLNLEFKNETDNQMYFGNVRFSYPEYPSDAIVTELNSGRFVMLATNVKEEGSEGLQKNKGIYERIFERFGLNEIVSVE